jgi:hypothetical protein
LRRLRRLAANRASSTRQNLKDNFESRPLAGAFFVGRPLAGAFSWAARAGAFSWAARAGAFS